MDIGRTNTILNDPTVSLNRLSTETASTSVTGRLEVTAHNIVSNTAYDHESRSTWAPLIAYGANGQLRVLTIAFYQFIEPIGTEPSLKI